MTALISVLLDLSIEPSALLLSLFGNERQENAALNIFLGMEAQPAYRRKSVPCESKP
jgi:hypothetical protein